MNDDNVAYFEDYQPMSYTGAHQHALVKPKTTSHTHAGHRFVLRYDPNASVRNRWHWTVRFTKTYEFTGTAASITIAERKARAQIDALTEFAQGRA
jgi:hypothetical protein